jgi:hypothetical protein
MKIYSMKQKFTFFFILFLSVAHLLAQVPATLSYQGLLTDANGNPVANGTHSVTFNFYTSSTGGTAAFSRGPLSVTTFQGLFTVILGNGGTGNAALPSLGSTQYYVGLRFDTGTSDLTPLVALTAVPYAFTASALDAKAVLPGSQVGTGINASNITTGTLAGARVGTGVSAANITTGTLPTNQLPALAGFSAARSAGGTLGSQSGPVNLTTLSGFDTPTYNTGGAFNAASGLFTAPSNGWYSFIAQIVFTNDTTPGQIYPYFQASRSGAPYNGYYMGASFHGTGFTRILGTICTYLQTGDTMGIGIGQNTGSIINYSTDGQSFYFQGVRLGN